MTIVHIDNAGSKGIIYDARPHDLPPEAWSDGQNMRFTDNTAIKFAGQTNVFGTPGTPPHWLLPWQSASEYRWIYPGTTKIYYTDGTSHFDVTRASGDYSAGARPIWSGTVLHGVPILNHTNLTDYPQQWDGGTSKFIDLVNWPANTYTRIIRSFKNRLIALDLTESATNYEHMLRWSTSADPGSVPASWDYTLATNDAGRTTLAETNGKIMDCLTLSNYNVVYKDDSIWKMQEIGGVFVFRFDAVSTTLGILAPRCVKEFYKRHLLVGTNDIVLFNGNSIESIVDKRMRRWFFNTISGDHYNKTVITPNYAQREIWISFVETGAPSEYLTKALVWNWGENSWTVKELPDVTHIGFGQVGGTVNTTFDSQVGAFDDPTDDGPFGESLFNPSEQQLLMSKVYNGNEFMNGDSSFQDRGASYTAYLERTGLAVAGVDREGRPRVDQSSVKFVRSIFPKITAQSAVNVIIRVGAQDHPNDPVRWSVPQTFNTATDVKLDVEVTGKYLAVRFEETSNYPWELAGYALDLDVVSML